MSFSFEDDDFCLEVSGSSDSTPGLHTDGLCTFIDFLF